MGKYFSWMILFSLPKSSANGRVSSGAGGGTEGVAARGAPRPRTIYDQITELES